MSKKIKNLKPDIELSLEEDAYIDRLLSEAAEADDSEVDYAAMLGRIKAAAKEEGIVIFPSRKAKRARVMKRVFTGIAAVAAVFILGFTVLTATKILDPFAGLSLDKTANHKPNADEISGTITPGDYHGSQTAFVSDHPKNTGSAPDFTYDPVIVTPDPANTADSTFEPVETPEVVPTPVPDMFASRGGLTGYVWLGTFLGDPADSMLLVPKDLPEYMEVDISDVELCAKAEGISEEGVFRSFNCRVLPELDDEMMIGAALFRMNDMGLLRYLWRVTDYSFLEVVFIGYTPEDAVSLLQSSPLIDPASLHTDTPEGETL
ncbi:MAG: hypothetical protein J5586_05460 [Clostridia bacterium]|nr:hypothetical protein [Clostridia bacterium]